MKKFFDIVSSWSQSKQFKFVRIVAILICFLLVLLLFRQGNIEIHIEKDVTKYYISDALNSNVNINIGENE